MITRRDYPFITLAACVLIAWLYLIFGRFIPDVFGAPSGVAQNIQIGSQVVMGLQSVYPQLLLQYQEPSTTTAQFSGATTVTVPANTTDNSVDCATLFPAFQTPIAIGLQDASLDGVALDVGTDNGGSKIHMAANGFIVYRVRSGLPHFYIDNNTSTDAALRVFGLSN